MPETTYPTEPAPPPPADVHQLAPAAAPDEQLLAKVRAALGFASSWRPSRELGETLTRLSMWTQMELNDLYERVGGTVAIRLVERPCDDVGGVALVEEITLTVLVEGVGPVQVWTDWCDEFAKYRSREQMPLMRAAVAVGVERAA